MKWLFMRSLKNMSTKIIMFDSKNCSFKQVFIKYLQIRWAKLFKTEFPFQAQTFKKLFKTFDACMLFQKDIFGQYL